MTRRVYPARRLERVDSPGVTPFLAAGILAAEGLTVMAGRRFRERPPQTDVFIAKAQSYTVDLKQVIQAGLEKLKPRAGLGGREGDPAQAKPC